MFFIAFIDQFELDLKQVEFNLLFKKAQNTITP